MSDQWFSRYPLCQEAFPCGCASSASHFGISANPTIVQVPYPLFTNCLHLFTTSTKSWKTSSNSRGEINFHTHILLQLGRRSLSFSTHVPFISRSSSCKERENSTWQYNLESLLIKMSTFFFGATFGNISVKATSVSAMHLGISLFSTIFLGCRKFCDYRLTFQFFPQCIIDMLCYCLVISSIKLRRKMKNVV